MPKAAAGSLAAAGAARRREERRNYSKGEPPAVPFTLGSNGGEHVEPDGSNGSG
ncbi:hypothetical protein [Streptomyces sp. NBC_00996]|uniref:hypothetical protein n=1 Tax=Streptomyces sp. NBC_00996 TaxID=2903710 RepID=UPI003867AE9E|nr:hypothetical protein OG390_36860 [Streptomyces sp. NBC_00996]